jgi:hypothetical protein
MQPRLVSEPAWLNSRAELEAVRRPMLGISMDPSGTRAAAVLSWQQSDGTVAVRLLADVTGDPIDTARFGTDLKQAALRMGVTKVGFDSLTDAELAKFFKTTEPITGQKWSNASAQFVNLVEGGRLRWDNADPVTEDLTWTARKPSPDHGSWQAVKAKDDRPIPAALAAIRAVWLASGPQPPRPRVF